MCSNTFSCPKSIPFIQSCTICDRLWRSNSSAIVYILSSSRLHFCLCPSLLQALHVCKCLPVVWLRHYFWHEQRCYVWCDIDITCRDYNKVSHFYVDTFTLLFVMNCFDQCVIANSVHVRTIFTVLTTPLKTLISLLLAVREPLRTESLQTVLWHNHGKQHVLRNPSQVNRPLEEALRDPHMRTTRKLFDTGPIIRHSVIDIGMEVVVFAV